MKKPESQDEQDERAALLAKIEREKARTVELQAQRAEIEAGILPPQLLAEMPLAARWAAEERGIMAGAIRREAEIVARLKAAREQKEINSTEAN